jgi:hypothetical protein
MVVVRHQAVAVTDPAVPLDHVAEQPKEELVVIVAVEDRTSFVAARGDVVERARELDAQRPCDRPTLRRTLRER